MNPINSFLATVDKVFPTNSDFLPYEKNDNKPNSETGDNTPIYNGNKNFYTKDARMYGAITYRYEDTINIEDYAFPFDKNNFTFPIKGETVTILVLDNQKFWLPYTNTPYSNYRRNYITYEATKAKMEYGSAGPSNSSASDLRQKTQTGGTSKPPANEKPEKGYKINEKIKFLKPREGDTILSGRVGNTIRFSEFFLTEDGKTSSPGIFIRNKQKGEDDSKKIGELVDEDINKDGTSVYITSGKIKVPFKETIGVAKVGFSGYPSNEKLTGNQLFINSDRIILSAKASEFIIFGKGNTGTITDGNWSVDAAGNIYQKAGGEITLHNNSKIFLNSESGNIFLGKDAGIGDAGASVQHMVLGGDLVLILQQLCDAIIAQQYLTPAGQTVKPTLNEAAFRDIKSRLGDILSSTNYLSK